MLPDTSQFSMCYAGISTWVKLDTNCLTTRTRSVSMCTCTSKQFHHTTTHPQKGKATDSDIWNISGFYQEEFQRKISKLEEPESEAKFSHVPVMVQEVVKLLHPKQGKVGLSLYQCKNDVKENLDERRLWKSAGLCNYFVNEQKLMYVCVKNLSVVWLFLHHKTLIGKGCAMTFKLKFCQIQDSAIWVPFHIRLHVKIKMHIFSPLFESDLIFCSYL